MFILTCSPKTLSLKTLACSLLFAFFILSNSTAQQFAPAYFLKEGQKTEGLIRIKAHNEVYFKSTRSSAGERLDPAQVDEFGFINYQESFKSVTDSAGNKKFARILVKGSASLYAINGYYLLQKESDPKGIFISTPAVSKNLELAKTLGRIKVYLGDYSNLTAKKVTSDELIKITRSYNLYKQVSDTKRKHGPRLGLSVVGGVSITNTSFSGISPDYLRTATFSTSTSPVLGMNVSFKPRKYLSKVNGGFEILYTQYSFTGHGEPLTTAGKEINDITLSYKNVRLPLFLTYHFGRGHEGLYITPAVTIYKYWDLTSHLESREVLIISGAQIKSRSSDDIFETTDKSLEKKSAGYAASLGIGWSKYISEKSKLNILLRGEYDRGIIREQVGAGRQAQKLTHYYLTANFVF